MVIRTDFVYPFNTYCNRGKKIVGKNLKNDGFLTNDNEKVVNRYMSHLILKKCLNIRRT